MATETRTGFSFNNSDLDNDFHAPEWGLLVSPEELRYNYLFGNKLVAANDNQAITDDQLNDYVRISIGMFERELNIHILPRLIRHMDYRNQDTGVEEARTDIDDSRYLNSLSEEQGQLYIRDHGYPYKTNHARHYGYLKLRYRPLIKILKAEMMDPYNRSMIDLLPYAKEKRGLSGVVHFVPHGQAIMLHPHLFGYNGSMGTLYYPFENYPEAIQIDYMTGYKNCADVPHDLREIIGKFAAVILLNIYGDGKAAGMASKSVNLNSVSESINTTMSATSAYFGARIIQYNKEIKSWLDLNRSKFSRTSIGAL